MKSPLVLLLGGLLWMNSPLLAAGGPRSAEAILTEAKAEAVAEHKTIFVHFGASWCGWCKRLEQFLADETVKPIFQKHFVEVKLVVQETDKKLINQGAEDVLKEVGGPSGLPFHAFLDEKGELIINSKEPANGNIGHPVQPSEVAWFMGMIKKAAPKMSADELNSIESALKNQKK